MKPSTALDVTLTVLSLLCALAAFYSMYFIISAVVCFISGFPLTFLLNVKFWWVCTCGYKSWRHWHVRCPKCGSTGFYKQEGLIKW